MKPGIRVYNLYPKLVGQMEKWIEHFDRIQAMHFNWVYLNPFHLAGFSGSDYAVKEHFQYHPLYVTGEYNFKDVAKLAAQGHELLRKVCAAAKARELNMMMDIVINHTAFDSPLTKTHPDWYLRNSDGTVKHPGALDGTNWVEWKDLAQIDNANSNDRKNLWHFWLKYLLFYADLGIRGFRCDAAYHVPKDLWKFLTTEVKKQYPDVIFLGETLGCTPEQVTEVAQAGFDYVMNSFMWWNYRDEWFLKDYRPWAGKYPSLTFPENHDTPRCAEQYHGNKQFVLMKYAMCAYICSSVATTIGFEYGFRRKIHVVETSPMWWEPAHFDISAEIAAINQHKATYAVLHEDNLIQPFHVGDDRLFAYTKESLDGQEKIMVIVNPAEEGWYNARVQNIFGVMGSKNIRDLSHGHQMEQVPEHLEYKLQPGEVKLFYAKREKPVVTGSRPTK